MRRNFHKHKNKGAFSPFMFGLLLGITAFSMSASYIAKKKLEEEQNRQAQTRKEESLRIKQGLENALLLETRDNYQKELDLARALAYTSGTTGKTRSGSDVQVKSFGDENENRPSRQIAISTSDNRRIQQTISETNTAGDLLGLEKGALADVELFDENKIRQQQIRTSYESMDQLAGHLYTYYAMHLKFPEQQSFAEIDKTLNLRDVWNTPFTYQRTDDEHALLSFTTPWGYKREIKLSLDFEE